MRHGNIFKLAISHLFLAALLALWPLAASAGVGNDFVDFIDDSAITTAIDAKLLAEPGLDSLDIKVETIEGVVTLKGVVDNKEQIAKADAIAKMQQGVKKVDNKLTLK